MLFLIPYFQNNFVEVIHELYLTARDIVCVYPPKLALILSGQYVGRCIANPLARPYRHQCLKLTLCLSRIPGYMCLRSYVRACAVGTKGCFTFNVLQKNPPTALSCQGKASSRLVLYDIKFAGKVVAWRAGARGAHADDFGTQERRPKWI